jgi:hypothetical protein
VSTRRKKQAQPRRKVPPDAAVPQTTEKSQPAGPPATGTAKVDIYYDDHEIGPAELLGEGKARIMAIPQSTLEFWQGDVVRLTHLPGEAAGHPRIAEVLWTRHDRRTHVGYMGAVAVALHLIDIFRLLRADAALVEENPDGRDGMLAVAHSSLLDPELIVKLVGADTDKCNTWLEQFVEDD